MVPRIDSLLCLGCVTVVCCDFVPPTLFMVRSVFLRLCLSLSLISPSPLSLSLSLPAKDFFRKHSGTFASMEKNWAKICEETTKIANYFGEDPTKFVLEGFFRSITAFMKDIEVWVAWCR